MGDAFGLPVDHLRCVVHQRRVRGPTMRALKSLGAHQKLSEGLVCTHRLSAAVLMLGPAVRFVNCYSFYLISFGGEKPRSSKKEKRSALHSRTKKLADAS